MQNNFDKVYEWFNGNPTFNIVTLLLAVVGIVLSFYFYFKSKKNKVPIYIVRSVNLVRESIKKIETVDILYAGTKIENLSLTKIALWNDGRDTISYNDVAHVNPLKICIDDKYIILDAEILFQKNYANDYGLSISHDRKSITINFDFFDFEEGAVIQLAHTGNSSNEIKILGTIKSVKKIIRKDILNSLFPFLQNITIFSSDKKLKKRTMLGLVGMVSTVAGTVMFVFPFIISNILKIPNKQISEERPLVLEYLSFGLTGLLYIYMGVRLLRRRIPKGFDIFDEEF